MGTALPGLSGFHCVADLDAGSGEISIPPSKGGGIEGDEGEVSVYIEATKEEEGVSK